MEERNPQALTSSELAKFERETHINWNELDDYAIVYTASRKIITKCQKAGYELVSEDKFGKQFKVPSANLISFRSVPKGNKPKKQLSEEHKNKLAEKRNRK